MTRNTGRSLRVAMLAAACAVALPMHALASTITDGDLESGFLCTNGPSCGVGSQTFSFGGPVAPATGSITADTIGLTLSFNFDLRIDLSLSIHCSFDVSFSFNRGFHLSFDFSFNLNRIV